MRNSLNRELVDLDTRNHVDSGIADLANAVPGSGFDWEPVTIDLAAWRARVARWEARAYLALILVAVAWIGITALVGAFTTTPSGLPS